MLIAPFIQECQQSGLFSFATALCEPCSISVLNITDTIITAINYEWRSIHILLEVTFTNYLISRVNRNYSIDYKSATFIEDLLWAIKILGQYVVSNKKIDIKIHALEFEF